MNEAFDQVRAAYSADPEQEWRRLESGARFRIEHLINTYALERHLPSPAADPPTGILDAGGGPGRYTIALAERGYTVTLLDLSSALLDLAARRIAATASAVQRRVEGLHEGSITDLSRFLDGRFDAVLCLGGVLSHVVEPEARQRALLELRRVAGPGAPLFITVLNRLGAYRSTVQWPERNRPYFPDLPEMGVSEWANGAPVYHFLPEEFVASLSEAGLDLVRLYGCSGLGAHLQESNLLALMADEERWPAWRKQLLATCDHPNIVGVSNLLLAVARPTDTG